MPNESVEPTGQPIQESQLPAGGVAQQASSGSDQNAMSSLREGLQKMTPASEKSEKKVESTPKTEEPAQKKEFPPVGSSDIKEQKQVESAIDNPAEAGSALEGFRTDLIKKRRAKEKDAQKPKEEKQEEVIEKKEEVSETPETAPKTTLEEDPVTEEEIQKTISDPAISKRHQKRMVFLANKAKELEKKLSEAEAKPQSVANDDKVKELTDKNEAAQKELIQFQRRYALENEPELKKFDEVAQKADDAIYGKLKGRISDKTIDLIKGMGGFGAFSKSGQVFNIKVEKDGDEVTEQITASQLAKRWLSDMDVEDSEFVKSKLGERVNALESKKSRSDALASESETWFKQKQEEHQRVVEAQQNHAKEYQAKYDKQLTEWLGKQEALKDKTVPTTATPEEKKEIENYNKHNAGIRAMVKMAISPTSIDDHIAIVEQAATSLVLTRDNARLAKELDSLKQQYEKLRAGVTTTGKPGGGSISKSKDKPKDDSAAAQLNTPVVDSLRDAMEKLREGKE